MTGEDRGARAFWVRPPGRGEIRPAPLPPVGPEEARVRTLRSAVSRGTEALVLGGHVPAGQYDLMRAPFQEGELPGPVKYGYLNVGTVEEGPASLRGRAVFCLYPHQTAYVVPAAALVPVPDEVPVTRAVLAGTVETAVNAVWDLGPLPGDRIAVVGAGMVGCCVARLLVQVPGVEVTLVDVDPARAATASALGVAFARPDDLGRPDDPGRPAAGPRAPAATTRSCTPAPPPPGSGSRWSCSRRTARCSSSAGTATGRSRSRWAAPSTRAGWRCGPARSARSPARAGTGVPATSGSPSRWGCSGTRRTTAC